MSIKFKNSFFSLSSSWVACSFSFRYSSSSVSLRTSRGGGSSHIDVVMWYTYMCVFLFRCYLAIFGMFSSEMKEPKLHELGVFWANYGKKHPIWANLGAFLSKLVYWRVGNCELLCEIGLEKQVRHANPRTMLAKVPPPGRQKAHLASLTSQSCVSGGW